jgi:putative addiction module component (TIGR02574 family)
MVPPILDFSHLTPDERIELAEQLWDSLPVSEQQPTEPVLDELRRRRAALEADGDPGEPWGLVVKGIGERGV